MDDEKEKMLQKIIEKRGYVLDFHKILIEEDLEFLKCYEALISTAYANQRTLDKKVKELIFIAALTALRADKSHIGVHIKSAVENGASKKEILGKNHYCDFHSILRSFIKNRKDKERNTEGTTQHAY